jgi:hypothetical protein
MILYALRSSQISESYEACRQTLLTLFPRRKHKPSPAEMENQFTAAEDRRQAEFNKRMLEYRARFVDEEKAQHEGEQWRSEEFNRMILSLDDAFEGISEKRDKAFHNEEARRRDIFQEQESPREKRFSEAENHRAGHFLTYQETSEKRAEWFFKIRESRLQRGRQEREEACRKLEKDMENQVERLLRWQEECFARAERQRDEIVREVVSGLTRLGNLRVATQLTSTTRSQVGNFPLH